MRTLSSALLVVLSLVLARGAGATPNFPPAIKARLVAKVEPPCRVCHTTGIAGGLGTVNTEFGKNMRARGLVAYEEPTLIAALDKMATEKVDSTKARGTSDIDVLKNGGDPNSVVQTVQLEPPIYGCGGDPPTSTFARSKQRVAGLGSAALLALGALLVRRRRGLTPR
ncbi:MAG: hypothetical protein JNL79_19325 [Myxococcales bacterium]|nr:hypothetical protein [Myxococcales bacterium]